MERAKDHVDGRLVLTDTSGLRDARRFVRDAAAHLGFDADRVADIQLAVSELVTNALEHGGGGDVVVATSATRTGIDVTVSSVASDNMPERSRDAVPPGALHGRGLVIAEAVADNLSIEGAEGLVLVRCQFCLADPTPDSTAAQQQCAATPTAQPVAMVSSDLESVVDYQALFEASVSPLSVLDPELRYVAVNPAYLAMVGRDRDQLVGNVIFDVFPEDVNPADSDAGKLRESLLAAFSSGETQTMPLQRYDVEDPSTGEVVERYWSVTNNPLRDANGEIAFVVNHPEEVTSFISERMGREASGQTPLGSSQSRGVETALSRVLARLTHLNDLSAAMVAANSVDEIASAIMREGMALVGAVGGSVAQIDGQRISLANHAGVKDEVRVRWIDYEMTAGGDPFSDGLLTGELVLVGDRDAFVERYPHLVEELDPEHAAWAVLPFAHDGVVVGAVGFIFGESMTWDLPLRLALSSVANIVNQTLARVLLLTEQSRTLDSMSSALLSPRLDSHSGVAIESTYRPATQRVRAGGDWFDVIELEGGAMLFVIGDVADHGTRAVGEMARARATVQAFAVLNERPDAVAKKASVVLSTVGATHATCCIAVYEPTTRELIWTTAGHPYPLIVGADGSTEFLAETHGPPLGIVADYGFGRRTLQRGDTVVLYTDGLIERRDELIDVGLNRLERVARTVLTESAGSSPAADSIVDALSPGGHNEDDIAVLLVSVR